MLPYIITIAIIVITGLVSYQAFEDRKLKAQFIFLPAKIKETGQWYRFFSSGLIHADWMHLLFNMYVLWSFGTGKYGVEAHFSAYFGDGFGRFLYLAMYVIAIGASSVPDYQKHQDYYGYAALGASGAVSAVVFASIFFNPWQGGIGIIFLPGSIPPMLFGALYLWYSSYMAKRQLDNIGHNAHFWGAVFGFVFILVVSIIFRFDAVEYFFSEFYKGLLIENW